ncbi:MAG: hypothetical protein R3A12_13465 [Ignavibacteria bacterium]
MTGDRLDLLKTKLQNFNIEYTDVNGTPAFYILKDDVLSVCNILKMMNH